MTVRAKFMVQSIQHIHSSEACAEITLRAVWGDGKGNEAWSKATPQGELKMMITNPAAIEEVRSRQVLLPRLHACRLSFAGLRPASETMPVTPSAWCP